MTSTLPQGPYGFKPIRHQNGGLVRPNTNGGYTIASNYGTSIFAGDLVSTTGTGRNVSVTAVAGTARGVYMGCQFVDSFGNVRFEKVFVTGIPIATGTVINAFVYDDPLIVFKAQTGNGSIANTNIGAYYNHGGQANGSLLTGMSAEYVDAATHANTSKTLFAVNLTQIPGNDFGGFSELEVLIGKHELNPGTYVATGS